MSNSTKPAGQPNLERIALEKQRICRELAVQDSDNLYSLKCPCGCLSLELTESYLSRT